MKLNKFVLVHGEGFGAWCWYKTIALLEEAGLVPIAIDLTGSGIDLADTNSVTTLAEYSKPLISYLENLPEDEQVRDRHIIPVIPIYLPCTLPVCSLLYFFYVILFMCRLFWLAIVLEVHVSLMHLSIAPKRSRKLFFSVLQWCLMVRGLLMCLLKRYSIKAYLLSLCENLLSSIKCWSN